VKKLMLGHASDKVVRRTALALPESLDGPVELVACHPSRRGASA
jgi:acetoacetyl-CoA synthetase